MRNHVWTFKEKLVLINETMNGEIMRKSHDKNLIDQFSASIQELTYFTYFNEGNNFEKKYSEWFKLVISGNEMFIIDKIVFLIIDAEYDTKIVFLK